MRYYIPQNSIFDSFPYDMDAITKIVKENGGRSVDKGKQFGWSNQPDVVLFSLESGDAFESDKRKQKIENALNTFYKSEWISVYKKDW
jgi:hypothetical protein